MGICTSCLGGRRRDSAAEDDESRLLFDDPNIIHYGSFGEQQMTGHDDPIEAQREIEALQRVVARTSDNMVDIFEIAPKHSQHDEVAGEVVVGGGGPAAYALAGQEARLTRYQNLLSKLDSTIEDYDGHDDMKSSTGQEPVVTVPLNDYPNAICGFPSTTGAKKM